MYLSVIGTFGFADPQPGETLSAWARLAGVQTVQGYRNPEKEPTVEQMLAWAAQAELTFDSIHGIFGPQFDPSSPDEQVRRRSVDAYRAEGDLALALGGPMIVVHPAPAMPQYDGLDRRTRWRQLARSINELSEIGQSLGVEYLIENQPPYHPIGSDTAELVAAVQSCRQANIGFCFDTGHAHMAGDEVAALASVGSLLRIVHASDNDGRLDGHGLCFEGTVNWTGVGRELKRMGFDGPFMFEVFLDAAEVSRRVTPQWIDRVRRTLKLDPRPIPSPGSGTEGRVTP
ncbi:MAG: endonuclease 4 [Phycisphaerae bacterium]|nr:endonuclease 4 [Phycisphaerae bacterium]